MLPGIGMISTFPPTRCGIAAFANSLMLALMDAGATVGVVDLEIASHPSPPESLLHRHRGQQDIPTTAHFLNSLDVAIIQHEFGIWDGAEGQGVIPLIGSLTVPTITVLHTVPAVATPGQRRILQQLLDVSDVIVVLSHSSLKRLVRDYSVRPGSVNLIRHGASLRVGIQPEITHAHTPRVLTWGLLGPGKGIEWGIRAMADLRDRHRRCDYVVAGTTHPRVRRAEGEAYRQSLIDLARSLGVQDRVHFLPDYLTDRALTELLATSDAVLLPYDSRDQVSSGVLVEAVAAGGPVVATRFPHAIEVLGTGAGEVVDHQDPIAISRAIEKIFSNPSTYARMRSACDSMASDLAWDKVAHNYLSLAERVWRRAEIHRGMYAVAPIADGATA
jgi:polysaccharide biosynthesis protein PslF